MATLAPSGLAAPIAACDGSVRAVKLAYDSLGRRSSVRSLNHPTNEADANVVDEATWEYNGLSAMTREYQEHAGVKGGGTLSVQYEYDANSDTYNGLADVYIRAMRLGDVVYPSGRKSFRNYGAYGGVNDKLSRLAAVLDDDGSGEEGSVLASYSYNGAGRLVLEDFEQPDVRLDYFGGTAGTYAGLDRFGRVRSQRWVDYDADANRDLYGYGYDYNSNRRYRENLLSSTRSEVYAHDALDRLIVFQRGTLNANKDGTQGMPSREEDFALDDVGNWTMYMVVLPRSTELLQDRTHNAANELVDIVGSIGPEWADPIHDAAGNMTGVPKPSDMTADYTCVYDAWNRLVEVRDGQTTVATYRYDGLNRRIRKVVAGSPDVTNDYYYNASWQVLEVRKDGASLPHEQYVWSARYIDAPILRDRNADPNEDTGDLGKTGSGLDERLYYLTDAQMNVTCLVDTSGAAVERYVYDAYGLVTVFDGSWTARNPNQSSYANEVLYCGYRFDTETGFYHVRHRMYHPLLGRWMQRDPIGYAGGGMNVYEYCASRPSTAPDPSGQGPMLKPGVYINGDGSLTYDRYKMSGFPQNPVEKARENYAYVQAEQNAADRTGKKLSREFPGKRVTVDLPTHVDCKLRATYQDGKMVDCELLLDGEPPPSLYDTACDTDTYMAAVYLNSVVTGMTGPLPPASPRTARRCPTPPKTADFAPKSGVPQSARDVAGKVKSNMGQPPDGHVGGRVFENAEGKLPQGGAYREYDVHPYTGANRGAERVVIDTKTGKAYYTNDHYQTFTEVPE